MNGYTEEEVTVKLLGGDLKIFWDRRGHHLYDRSCGSGF